MSNCSGLFACERPRAREGLRKRCVQASVEEALKIFGGTRGPAPSDEALWAKFAWIFGWGRLRDAVHQGEAEMAGHPTPIPEGEKPKVLQNILNQWWQTRRGGKGAI